MWNFNAKKSKIFFQLYEKIHNIPFEQYVKMIQNNWSQDMYKLKQTK